jgi:transposase
MKQYESAFKEQIIREIKEVGNISLVSKKHGLRPSTVHGWLHNVKHADKISDKKVTRELQKKIRDQEHEILVLRSLLKKTFPLWNNEKELS